ncbi:8664_t:CDS:2, partial [Ambispora leptoticha]
LIYAQCFESTTNVMNTTKKAICPQFICEKYQCVNSTLEKFYHWIDRDVEKDIIIARIEQILEDEFVNIHEFVQHLTSDHTTKNMLPFIGFLFENHRNLTNFGLRHDKMTAKRHAMEYYEKSAQNENQYGQLFLGNILFGNHSTKKAIYCSGLINKSFAKTVTTPTTNTTSPNPIPILNPLTDFFSETYPDDILDFSVIGDWGFPGENQTQTSNAMSVYADRFDTKFIINVGDSFYVGGIYTYDGVSNASDPKFNTIWKKTYTGKLGEIPWYGVAGNHEWYNNVTAEVDYSRTVDARFFLPSLYYTRVSLVGPNQDKIAWIHIDTNPFYYTDLTKTKKKAPVMYNAFVRQGWNTPDAVENLLKWVEDQLVAHQDAKWIFVIGHHPLVGTCQNFGKMNRLPPLFENYRVAAYFSGHNHALAYQQPTKSSSVEYFLVGSGSKVDDICDGRTWGVFKTGFVHITLSTYNDTADFQYVDASDPNKSGGVVAYSGTIKPRPPHKK